MIATVESWTVWGCVPGQKWQEYETWPTFDAAVKEVEGLRDHRNDRIYMLLPAGDLPPTVGDLS